MEPESGCDDVTEDVGLLRLLEAPRAENDAGSECDEDGEEGGTLAQGLHSKGREPEFGVDLDRILQLQGSGTVARADEARGSRVKRRYLQLERWRRA